MDDLPTTFQKEITVDFVPTPVLAVETDHITPQIHHSGHIIQFTTRWQGSKRVQQRMHDYSYGRSDTSKRPKITPSEDQEWLDGLNRNRVRRRGAQLAGSS